MLERTENYVSYFISTHKELQRRPDCIVYIKRVQKG